MLRVSGKVHVDVGTNGVSLWLVNGEYEKEDIGGKGFDSRNVSNIFLCTGQEAAEVMNGLRQAMEEGRELSVPVPESAKEYLAVYEYFQQHMTADTALGGSKKALELVEIWARGNDGPCDRGTVTTQATGSGHSEA